MTRKIGSDLELTVTTRRVLLIPEPLQSLLQFDPACSEIRLQCEALLQARYSLCGSLQMQQRAAKVMVYLGRGGLNCQRLLKTPERVIDPA